MTDPRGGHRAVIPFRPTETPDHIPTTCTLCGRRATGLGFGSFKGDPKFVCNLCADVMSMVKQMTGTKLDLHELAAVERAGKRAGTYLERLGKTDLADLTKGEWGFFLREIIEGFGDELRREIRNGAVQ